MGQLLEEPKNIVYCFPKEKEDLASGVLSLCSYTPSKVPVKPPHLLGGDVEVTPRGVAWDRHCA